MNAGSSIETRTSWSSPLPSLIFLSLSGMAAGIVANLAALALLGTLALRRRRRAFSPA